MAREWQFDGLVGPTHNYAGLAHGNLAASNNAGAVSNPRAAALQGLEKMWFVRELGVPQAFIPPHFRPLITELKRLGFEGTPASILQKTADYSMGLLASVYSSSFMWAANAATITPSCDSRDGKLHITPSNMVSHFHRAVESGFGYQLLYSIFHNKELFRVHPPLFPNEIWGDEGAANHLLYNLNHGLPGDHIFVFGDNQNFSNSPQKFPARQKHMASEAIARRHQINPHNCIYLQQSPRAIDQGVFHNDVIAMNTTRRMIVHEEAFTTDGQQRLRQFAADRPELIYREITDTELSVAEAVETYFFNSQLLDLGGDRFVVLAPGESETHPAARRSFERLQAEGIISEVHYRDLRESMRNGGGPACLRLRIAMTAQEEAAMHPGIILTETRYHALKQWVTTHYRDRLQARDLCDPGLLAEVERAYLALEEICDLPGLYRAYLGEN